MTPPTVPTPLRYRRAVAVVVAAVALGVAAVLWVGRVADVRLTGVNPPSGAVLTVPPRQIGLVFTKVPRPGGIHLTVTGPDGSDVTSGEPTVDGRRITVPVTVGRAGGYTVVYHVRLTDGREATGRSGFTVTPGTAGADPDAGVAAPVTTEHAHGQRNAFSLVLICLDLLLVGAVLVLMRPRHR